MFKQQRPSKGKRGQGTLYLPSIFRLNFVVLILFTIFEKSMAVSVFLKENQNSLKFSLNFMYFPAKSQHKNRAYYCKSMNERNLNGINTTGEFGKRPNIDVNVLETSSRYAKLDFVSRRRSIPLITLKYKENNEEEEKLNQKEMNREKEKGLLNQAVWYLSEGLGDLLGNLNSFTSSKDSKERKLEYERYLKSRSIMNLDDSIELLRADYDKVYFVTGDLNLDIYDENCIFADPFVSFTGLDRFKKNLDNLGGYLEDVTLKLRDFQVENIEKETARVQLLPNDLMEKGYREEEITMVKASWNFKCIVALLPWKPLLACKGSTKHFFDKSTGRIVKHDEGWEIETIDALKQLLKPSKKK